jgi:predicted nucleotidyltransferase
MKIAGIICEYNPFHNGHKYLVERAKEDGAAVVAVMSGNYTQRGELAVADKYVRAESAIKNGADLVLELPFPFCMSSAEFFSKGGVAVLERIGANKICFGSESGDGELIKEAAKAAASEEFIGLKNSISVKEGAAARYFEALEKVMGEKRGLLSNDILGVEYVKEINRRGLDMEIEVVKRLGDAYRDEKINSSYASATAIRGLLNAGENAELADVMPTETLEVLKNAVNRGEAPVSVKKIETALLAFWRLADPSALGDIAELGNGLEFRIKDAAMTSSTFEELERNSATKSYTSAKIRRAILFGALGVTKADLDSEPHYTTVLAANKIGREILSSLRKEDGEMVIVTKPADAPACRQSELSARADALYTLALPTAQNSGYLTKKKIYME